MPLLLLALALLAPFRVDSGPYAGAYVLAHGGAVNWYFASTSLMRLRQLPLRQTREYLDAYLAHLDPNDGIADALPQASGIFAPIAPDSEDAYAATALSLAVRYVHQSHDARWWRRTSGTWSDIAYAKLLTKIKPNGLIRASGTDATGYLMDNVEDYAGLRDFASVLSETHANNAHYVASFVAPLGAAIHREFDAAANAFRWSDNDPIGAYVPYPACTAQLFPQLYNVTSGNRATDLHHFAGARKTAARCHFSVTADPHEALLYALYLQQIGVQTQKERVFASRVRQHASANDDIVTISLLDALGA